MGKEKVGVKTTLQRMIVLLSVAGVFLQPRAAFVKQRGREDQNEEGWDDLSVCQASGDLCSDSWSTFCPCCREPAAVCSRRAPNTWDSTCPSVHAGI